jgi:hypothetical protein
MGQITRKIYEPDFMRAMNALEVGDLWQKDKTYLKLVNDIHADRWVRVVINSLLIKKLTNLEISRIIAAKFSVPQKEQHIDTYSRFFFNPSRMTRLDWKRYIKRCNEKERRTYFTALTEPVEVLKTELELPTTVDVSGALQWLLTKSFLKAKTYIGVATPEAGKEAREWIDQVVKLTDKYEKYRSGDQSDFAKSLQMEFDFLEDTFDTPDDDIAAEVAEKLAPKSEGE